MNADAYRDDFTFALLLQDVQRERSRQSDAGTIGVSDLGVCHEQTRRKLTNAPVTDAPSRFTAMVGTWLDAGVKEARKAANPRLITDAEVTVTLPSGLVLTGHPDEIDPDEPGCTDTKSKDYDGLAYVRRNHSPDHHRYQRHNYGLGAVQTGLLPKDREVIVRNVYLDRSGKDPVPHVEQEPLSMDVIRQADDWYADVLYAVENGEEASKDKPVSWCMRFCEYATGCRFGDHSRQDVYDDPQIIQAALTYHDAHETGAVAERERKAAKELLVASDVNGIAGPVKVRKSWTGPTKDRAGFYTVHTELLPGVAETVVGQGVPRDA